MSRLLASDSRFRDSLAYTIVDAINLCRISIWMTFNSLPCMAR